MYSRIKSDKTGIEQPSYIDATATIGKNVYIGCFSYIGKNAIIADNVKIFPQVYVGDDVEIKDNTVLYPGVKVYRECKIGADCIIHSGSIIGGDGFGFAPKSHQDYKKIPQIGNVIIEENVEIGCNTTIDRATIGSTIIRKGVKLDNLIQIAHNVEIGEHTVIAALTGISGSTKVGKDCMIAGQVGIIGHAIIADEVKIGAQCGVASSIKEKGAVQIGSPNQEIRSFHKSAILFKRLPEMNSKLMELERELQELKKKLNEEKL
jgi:UDP-3-O-[3-hydroxymyristoyl] glucosamine N-acyltransferase